MVLVMIGYKLFRKRKDGTYGPLFIDATLRVVRDKWYRYKKVRTKGYAFRPGWHVLPEPVAPHLSTKGRVWCRVEFDPMDTIQRPSSQGGLWYLGSRMRVLEELA
jgi:hypothetical protein|tara:strand:- start:1085 stop:1399 length:315 start_codon:yes stop_codon:yes gene_type:complete